MTVRVGIIGAGRFAATHIENFRKANAQVVAIARRDPEALQAAKARWDVPYAFSDYRDLLRHPDVEAIAIVTPTDSHDRIALDAIEARKHVLCEKPLALRTLHARTLLAAAERAGIVHVVNFNQRSRTAVGSMQRYLAEGYVGQICHLNISWGICFQYDVRPEIDSWRFRAESGGGPIHEMVHVFDFARFLVGEVKRICTLASTTERFRAFRDAPQGLPVSVPDAASHLIQFDNGATGTIYTSFLSRGIGPSGKSEPHVEVTGTVGRIATVDGHGLEGIHGGQGRMVALDRGPPILTPHEEFVRAISIGAPVTTSFVDGYRAAQLVDSAYLSVAEQRWVSLESWISSPGRSTQLM